MNRSRKGVLPFLFLFTAAGCGGPRMADVQGTVRLNGQPLPDVEVYFIPDGESGTRGPRSAAVTNAEGRYRLESGDPNPGAVVGHHRVVLVDHRSLPPVPDERVDAQPGVRRVPQSSRIPPEYTAATTTPLRREVASGPQTIDLDLPAKP